MGPGYRLVLTSAKGDREANANVYALTTDSVQPSFTIVANIPASMTNIVLIKAELYVCDTNSVDGDTASNKSCAANRYTSSLAMFSGRFRDFDQGTFTICDGRSGLAPRSGDVGV